MSDDKEAYLDSTLLSPLGRCDHSVTVYHAATVLPRPKDTKIRFRKKSFSACANLRDALSNATFSGDVVSASVVEDADNLLLSSLSEVFENCFLLRTNLGEASLKLLINSRDRAYSEKKTLKYL